MGASCIDLINFGHCADFSLALRPKFLKNSTISTANTRIYFKIAESSVDSAIAQNLAKNKIKNPLKSFCYFLLLQKVESILPSNLNPPSNANSQNLT